MRKTSQDGGDTSSITSGVENETRKSGGILKTKRSSIKRKVQGCSHESDDAVIEPLLQKDKEKSEMSNQCAKFDLLSKTKTEAASAKRDDKEKLLQDYKTQNSTMSDAQNFADIDIIPSSSQLPKSTGAIAPLHNHMNTNVFTSHEALKCLITTKSQILVEIDGSKQAGYNPSPVIFTTAKIHTDAKNKHMEPLQVTPVPILSTIELSLLKGTSSSNNSDTSGLVTSNISPTCASTSKSNTYSQSKDQKIKSPMPAITTLSSKTGDNKALNTSEKQSISSVTSASAQNKKNIETPPVSNKKDLNIEKSPASQLKDNMVLDNKPRNIEFNKEKDGSATKLFPSQPVTGPSLGEAKTTVVSGTPAINALIAKSSISHAKKDSTSVLLDAAKINKVDDPKEIEQKIDSNKNIKSNVSRASTSLEAFDNKSGNLAKDKTALNATSTSTKQLQRQKITIEKDEPTTKSKSNTSSSSLSNESKPIIKPDDSTAPNPKTKSSANDVSHVNEKAKSLVSNASNAQNTSHLNTKPATNTVESIITKTTSNSITSAKPIVTSHSTALQQTKTPITKIANPVIPSTVSISLPNNSKKTDSEGKYTSPSSTKAQSARPVSAKPSTSVESGTKLPNFSMIETSSTTSQPISNIKSTIIGTKDAVVKPVPSEINKSTGSNLKSSITVTSTAKSTPTTISTTKAISKSPNIAKNQPVTTNTAKIIPVSTSVAKSSVVSTGTAKSTPISTNSIKTTPVISNASKSTTTKSSITSTSKANVTSPAVSNTKLGTVSTIATSTSTGSTSNSTVPNEKTEAKSTELSNGNKSLKA